VLQPVTNPTLNVGWLILISRDFCTNEIHCAVVIKCSLLETQSIIDGMINPQFGKSSRIRIDIILLTFRDFITNNITILFHKTRIKLTILAYFFFHASIGMCIKLAFILFLNLDEFHSLDSGDKKKWNPKGSDDQEPPIAFFRSFLVPHVRRN